MKKTRTKILAGVVLLAAVLLITGIVWAEATKTSIAGTMTVQISGPPARFWIDDDVITHYRGLPAAYVFLTGDLLDGTGSSVVNVDIDPLGNGDESGAATINATWGELSGTLEGRLTATYTYGISTGTAVYHGTSGGDFEGMKMMLSYRMDTTTAPPGEPWLVTYDAIILDPHGE